jgi:hypothetical protein
MSQAIYTNAALATALLAAVVKAAESWRRVSYVAITRGGRSALCGAVAAALALAVLIALLLPEMLSLEPSEQHLLFGTWLLVTGMRWMRKAILWYAAAYTAGTINSRPNIRKATARMKPTRLAAFDYLGFLTAFRICIVNGYQRSRKWLRGGSFACCGRRTISEKNADRGALQPRSLFCRGPGKCVWDVLDRRRSRFSVARLRPDYPHPRLRFLDHRLGGRHAQVRRSELHPRVPLRNFAAMSTVFFVLREIGRAFADDYGFTLTILAWIFVVGFINLAATDERWRAPIFLIGLLAILLLSIAFSHSPSAPSHKPQPKHTR